MALPRRPPIRRLLRLLLIGLPKLLRAHLQGRNTRWWRYELNRSLGRGLLVRNVNRADHRARPRRALLCYIVAPFLMDPDSPQLRKHTNRWRALTIARILDELGYRVDVLGYDDFETPVQETYDLLLGLGRSDQLAESWSSRALKVFLGTGAEPRRANDCIRRRTTEASRRRRCQLELRRLNPFPPDKLRHYDALACLGSEHATAEYAIHTDAKIYSWQNHSYDELVGIPANKDFGEARRHFLYFGTSGQILCGLDLLLEVFARRPELNLHVCGPFQREKDFLDCFHRELFETPNIHPLGWVHLDGPEFLDLTRRCGLVIIPMCPAYSHGSVVICMGRGLVPVVPEHVAGIDTDQFGTTLRALTQQEIGRVVDRVADRPKEWFKTTSRRIVESCRRELSQVAFERRFRTILEEITLAQRGH